MSTAWRTLAGLPRRVYRRARRFAADVPFLVRWKRRASWLFYRARDWTREELMRRPHLYRRLWSWSRSQLADLRARRREPRLTVGVDVSALWEPLTGVGWYLYQLLVHLADRDDLRLRLYGPTVVPSADLQPPRVELPTGRALEPVLYEVPAELETLGRGRLVRRLRRLDPLLVAADGNDVLFAPNYRLPRDFRFARGAVVACILDLGFRHFRWTMNDATLAELERDLGSTLSRARHLLTISESVRREIVAAGLAAPERVTAVHLGPGQLAEREDGELPPGVPHEFVLFVGTLEPRKNLGTLLAAWELLAGRREGVPPLVLCGRRGWKSESVERHLRQLEERGLALHLGYVAERHLAGLYRAARMVVFPSLYEGFGLPLVEAMCAGTPALVSDIPVLREVGGDAALYADAEDPEAWASAAGRLLDDAGLRRRLVERGRRRLRRFDWRRTADETARVLAAAADGGRGAA